VYAHPEQVLLDVGFDRGHGRNSFPKRSECSTLSSQGSRPFSSAARPGNGSVRRYYDPQTGQFISVDPLVDQTEAPYAYVNDDPVDAIDPLGLGCGWTSPWDCGSELVTHSSQIAAVSAFVAVLPIPGVDLVAGAVAVVAGGVAAYNDACNGRWLDAGLDLSGVALGGASLYDTFLAGRLATDASRAWRLGPIADWLRADSERAAREAIALGKAGFAISLVPFGVRALDG
jgi:hypothetical protein